MEIKKLKSEGGADSSSQSETLDSKRNWMSASGGPGSFGGERPGTALNSAKLL
jgi:hypothetical protein